MNTAELKPIDARTMKPGDPVVHLDGSPGKFIAYVPEATESNRAIVFLDGRNSVYSYTFDGRTVSGDFPRIFLPPDPDPIDPSPGNVDKLRKSQVGEGWRIVEHGEKPDRRAKLWVSKSEKWVDVGQWKSVGYLEGITYRVPIAPIRMVPLSMTDFIGKPLPLVRVEGGVTFYVVCGFFEGGVWAGSTQTFITWADLRTVHELSWDHGKTWVRAEKEEQA